MPALQVRDFPATLYDELKECAARNHRSIAQQTIIAVEEMLSKLRRRPPLVLGVGYRKIPNVRLPAERATSSLLRSIGGGRFARRPRGTSGTVEEAPAAFRRVR